MQNTATTIAALFALIALGAPAAQGQTTPPGAPNSPERRAYCEARQNDCAKGARSICMGPLPAGQTVVECYNDVREGCAKEFGYCLEGGVPADAGTSPPPPTSVPAAAGTATTPGSCSTLIRDMLAYVQENPLHRVHVVWTTNYFAGGTRYAGVSSIMLRAHGLRALTGEGQRNRTFFGGHHVATENVSLRVTWDQKVTLQNQYGPYPITCTGQRFAVAYTGDSVEVFNFKFPPH